MQSFQDDNHNTEDNQPPVWWVVAALGLVLLLAATFFISTQPEPLSIEVRPPPPSATPAPTATAPPIRVHVVCAGDAGPINQSLNLPPGARVEDALQAADCALEKGDTRLVNLAERLRDGAQIYLADDGNRPATPLGPIPLRINQANQEELEKLPGIGPTLATRLLEWRATHGVFTKIEDLDAVPGFGPALLEKLRDHIAFD